MRRKSKNSIIAFLLTICMIFSTVSCMSGEAYAAEFAGANIDAVENINVEAVDVTGENDATSEYNLIEENISEIGDVQINGDELGNDEDIDIEEVAESDIDSEADEGIETDEGSETNEDIEPEDDVESEDDIETDEGIEVDPIDDICIDIDQILEGYEDELEEEIDNEACDDAIFGTASEGVLHKNKNEYYSPSTGYKVSENNYVISVWGTNCSYKIEGKRLSSNESSSVAKATTEGGNIVVTGGTEEGRLDIKATDGTKYIIYNYSSRAEFKYLYELFHDKKVSVLGDSISTLKYNIPAGYEVYNDDIPYNNMFWGDIFTRFGAKSGVIDAWSGSTIGQAYHPMASWPRIESLGSKGTPDIILYFGGTNKDVVVGEFNSNADYAKIATNEIFASTSSANASALHKMRSLYPNTLIVQLIPYYSKTKNQGDMIRKMADYYNIVAVDLCELKERKAISPDNALHPNAKGHKQISTFLCEQVYKKRAQVTYELSDANRTVTFDAKTNGGSCDVTSMPVRNSDIKSVQAFKFGYKFAGWYTKSAGGTKVKNFNYIGFSTTVYAQFIECSHLHLEKVYDDGKGTDPLSYTIRCLDCGKTIVTDVRIQLGFSSLKGCEGSAVTRELLPGEWEWKSTGSELKFPKVGTKIEAIAVYCGEDCDKFDDNEREVKVSLQGVAHCFEPYNRTNHKCSACGIEGKHNNVDDSCTECGEDLTIPVGDDGNAIANEDDIPSELWVSGIVDKSYTGSKIVQDNMKVYWNYKLLNPKTDYDVKYSKNTAAGKATVTITGKCNYSGSIKRTFLINPVDLSEAKAFEEEITIGANGKSQKPTTSFTIDVDGKTVSLKKGIDYQYIYPEEIISARDNYYEVTIKGCGNYCGTKSIKVYVVDNKIPVTQLKFASVPDQSYTGEEVTPLVAVTYNGDPLKRGEDFIIEKYTNNINVGKATMTVKGIGGYTGTKTVAFNIVGTPIKKATVTGVSDVVFGDKINANSYKLTVAATSTTPEITLKKDVDYKVSFDKIEKAGEATVSFEGINGYTGTLKKKFTIKKRSVADASRIKVLLPVNSVGKCIVSYQKNGAEPEVTVMDGDTVLTKGVDYTVKYKNNKAVTSDSATNKPMVVVKGKGNYEGSSGPSYFSITGRSLSEMSITATDIAAKSKANICKPVIKLRDDNGALLKAGVDYDKKIIYTYKYFTKGIKQAGSKNGAVVDYLPGAKVGAKDIIPAGTVIEATVTGKGLYSGTKEVTFKFVGANISTAKVVIPNFVYTQKPITLDAGKIQVQMTVNGKTKTLTMGTDFRIVPGTYRNNVNKGTAKVTIEGIGEYGGTKVVSYRIVAKSMNYKIIFNKNNPSAIGSMKSVSIPSGTKLPTNTYKLSGKKFKCWCTKPNEDDAFAKTYSNQEAFVRSGMSILSFGDEVTLYAIWK